ncbi:hypothetical protein RBS60_10905 [Sinomonas sp. ASV486]|uniref:hypothetical protein n=1 Tax=Sinomonas sp. ASV486 TaxID=3051170 RepID=UPI0027DC56F4|nr:hypothetical protein [Sinomonas sp. ASV486]MDQ4490707.1 hypothetical protein [Sinomonas sp. ASV486]
MHDTDPVAPVLSVVFQRKWPVTWLLTVLCPYCRRKHLHGSGGPELDGDLGHRLAHCAHGGSYRLVITVETDLGD